MSNILNEIIAHKRKEVAQKSQLYPVELLEKSIYFDTPCVSLSKYLKREDKSGIIAEFKRRSPSKGAINNYASVEEVSIGYMQAGASALSVLTDEHFFGGKNADLTVARKYNFCPILRKDFVVDEYQIIEARSIGADAILLIASCLTAEEMERFGTLAQSLGMEVLVEIHDRSELQKLGKAIDVIGVNNRDLTTFEVNIQQSIDLLPLLPKELVKISESGLNDPNAVVQLKHEGYDGFLIGEHFMRHADPGQACREFVMAVERLENLLEGAIA